MTRTQGPEHTEYPEPAESDTRSEYVDPEPPDPRAPDWFRRALSRPRSTGELDVAGTTIRYQAWGDPATPATVLVHGGAAHAMWWAPLAALLDPESHVVAMDLSGHGVSGRRPAYSVDRWVDEIVAVAETASERPATIVGHSLGGIILSHAAVRHGHRFRRVVLLDSPVWPGAPAPLTGVTSGKTQRSRTYGTPEEALRRFRLVPTQDCDNDWYVRHIAWHGLHRGDTGWRWRFDPAAFAGPEDDDRIVRFAGRLADSRCPWALMFGALSYLTSGALEAFGGDPDVPFRIIPGAAHHVMLDQPLRLLHELRTLLAEWG
ncbi:alpha/beta hydrolase [Saccharomonospora azurea]|uniref:alpha/beta fold hydrolase n=1 Tax=Saccharomonospora azurea TaxID=40988 RepID=UPI003326319F